MTTVHSDDLQKSKYFDLFNALHNLGKINVAGKGSSQFTVKYPTNAILESQKVWMISRLDKWYLDLEKLFNVKITGKWFECDEKYSLILKFEIPLNIDWTVISDGIFRQELIHSVYQHFARRIKEYPLPFKNKEPRDIPVAPNAMCKYIFNRYVGGMILGESEAEKICRDNFKHDIKKIVEENNGIFSGIRVESIREGRYKIGYFEYICKDITCIYNPIVVGVNNVISKHLDSELFLKPCGEKDIV